jgi:hypothetical protein
MVTTSATSYATIPQGQQSMVMVGGVGIRLARYGEVCACMCVFCWCAFVHVAYGSPSGVHVARAMWLPCHVARVPCGSPSGVHVARPLVCMLAMRLPLPSSTCVYAFVRVLVVHSVKCC